MKDSFHPTLPPWPHLADETVVHTGLFELQRVTRQSPTTAAKHSFLRLVAPDWVNIVAITDEGLLVLVEQYRHGTGELSLEIPGGAVDDGETPREAAVRELEEETGYQASEVHAIGDVRPNPAFLTNTCWTFLAVGCRRGGELRPDPSEEIAVHLVELEMFARLIDDGAIDHSLVIAAHDHLQRGRRRAAPWAQRLSELRNGPPELGR